MITQHQLVKKLLSTTHFASISSIYRLLSTSLSSAESISENPTIKTPFAVEYLVKSCGIPTEKAVKASKYIPHLRSPAKPDSVLQFLRQIGLADADITRAVTSDPTLLCASLENTIKPRVSKVQEMGFSPAQVARLIPLTPIMLKFEYSSLQRRVEFWSPFLGSLEGILRALKKAPFLLTANVENVVEPNISFLKEHCGLSLSQIGKIVTTVPTLFTMNPNKFGAKIKNLKNLSFTEEEIDSLIKKQPMLLSNSAERIRKNVDFLTSEAGLDLAYISCHPILISFSLEKRVIPRNYVLKSLKSKALCGNFSFYNAMCISKKRFMDTFVTPNKNIIPEVCEAFEAACAGKISLQGKL